MTGRELNVGFDLGDNSVGLAAISCASDGTPLEIPYILTVIHDSARDGMASSQTAHVSRKASGGAARRARRLLKNRRKRSRKLQRALEELGYPIIDANDLGTYEEWDARATLLAGFVIDEAERRRLVSIAIRHMSNHRGWANAWVPIEQYVWKEEPSAEFGEAVEAIIEADRFGDVDEESLVYQSDIAQIGLHPGEMLRQRAIDPVKRPNAVTTPNLLGQQRRIDVVREFRQICRMQQIPDSEFHKLATIAFGQEKPKVPLENVGKDWLPGFRDKPRATVASLEHQEFQVRQTVANLSIRTRPLSVERHRLTLDQQTLIVDHLLGVTNKDHAPTWKEIAQDFLEISPRLLVHMEPDQSLSGTAPVMRSVTTIHGLPAKHPVREQWTTWSKELRSAFILWLADPAEQYTHHAELFEELFEDLDEKQLEAIAKLKFPAGRSAHSLESLRLMNEEMQRSGDTYVQVRNRLFNDGKDLRPTNLQTLDTQADHPTLQRVLPIVRRFLLGLERSAYGHPTRIVVEHVRSALAGLNAKHEMALEQGKNRRARERAQADIASAGLGLSNATDGEIKKFLALSRQGGACLYCGGTITFSSCQMDHIVPRKSGGNNTRANLVAVCTPCNQAKGKLPFKVFADSGRRPGVSYDEAVNRVKSMQRGEIDARAFRHITKEMIRRLAQIDEEDPVDERSLASTAYAAVDMIERIKTHYDDPTGRIAKVYSGRIVSMARHASGIDKRLGIRPGVDAKSRFDRRHHAIDAAVAAMLTPTVARVLAVRGDLRDSFLNTGEPLNWKYYEGANPAEVDAYRTWKAHMDRLTELIHEKLLADEVVVMQPVRFSARHTALHEAGRAPHAQKTLGESWTAEERALIVDDRVYEELSRDVRPSDDLPEAEKRTLQLPNGRILDASGQIYLFPDTAARIPLPNFSSAELGQSMHHARLYRWRDTKDRIQAGFIRIWASDLYDLEGGISGDILTATLHESSRAARRANKKLRDALHAGEAEHVGTLMVGDELYINPSEWSGNNEPGRFLSEWPEHHWRISGLMENRRFTITPLYLSQEGAFDKEKPNSGSKRMVPVSELALKVISDRLRISASSLWKTPSTKVIRRTAMGIIRENPSSGLPITWSPHRAVFSEE